jgi:glycosyltransferase involved in cell wall biosynthesis
MTQKVKQVLQMPDYRKGNPYQILLQQTLEKEGFSCSFSHFSYSLFPLLHARLHARRQHKHIDVIHIHWIVDIIKRISWSKNPIMFYLKCILMMVDCWMVRLSGVKVIWTIHNKLAHEQLDPKREIFIRKTMARAVSRIIIHSKEALRAINILYDMDLTSKTSIIFHGNYIGVYPEPSANQSNLRKAQSLDEKDIIVGHVGMLRPYKGIETLIQAFKKISNNRSIKLLIAGKPADEDYKLKLENLIDHHPNITCDFSFLSEQTLTDYLAISDVVCLPFSDTLTSGSTLLAMSSGKALVLPTTAKIFGCVPEEGVIYFDNQQELENILLSTEIEALKNMGKQNRNKAEVMSWEAVGKLTQLAYNGRDTPQP